MAGKDAYKLRHLEDQHQSLKKTPRVERFGRQKNSKNCISRPSKRRKMNLYKDKLCTSFLYKLYVLVLSTCSMN